MPFTEFLYHFTDARNIPSIKEHGLLSLAALKAKLGYDVGKDFYPASSSNSREIDYEKKLNNYIRLCADKKHPMTTIALNENRIQNITWIRLKFKDVVFTDNFREEHVKFSNKNAARNDAIINSRYETFTQSFDTQKEVLVRYHIPISRLEFLEN